MFQRVQAESLHYKLQIWIFTGVPSSVFASCYFRSRANSMINTESLEAAPSYWLLNLLIYESGVRTTRCVYEYSPQSSPS